MILNDFQYFCQILGIIGKFLTFSRFIKYFWVIFKARLWWGAENNQKEPLPFHLTNILVVIWGVFIARPKFQLDRLMRCREMLALEGSWWASEDISQLIWTQKPAGKSVFDLFKFRQHREMSQVENGADGWRLIAI